MSDPLPALPGTWFPALDALHEAVIAVSNDQVIRYLNPAARRLFAWSEELTPPWPLAEVLVDLPMQDEGRSLTQTLCARTEEAGGQARRRRVRRRDKVEIEVELTASPVLDEAGRPWILLLLRRPPESVDFDDDRGRPVHDPPERSYQLVFENAPVGIFHFDARGVITACNERFVQILGSSKQLLIGLDMRTLPNTGMVACVNEAIAGKRTVYDGDYTSATGQRHRILRVSFAPIASEEGSVSGGVGIVEDVTEARRAQHALSRADRMASLGTLAAGIAHEINNPLAYVLTSLEIALRALARAPAEDGVSAGWIETQVKTLEQALEGSDRVRRIVSDLGAFSRPLDLPEGSADLRRVLDSAATLAWNEIRHRARLVKNYGKTARARGEEPRLVQVFLNLLLNAAQAIPDGDAEHNLIEVGVTEGPDALVIEIRDTGGGIPKEAIDHIFEPFFTTKAVGQGTGLGLSVCHGIISSLEGTISAHPSAGGTTMRVVLPRGDLLEGAAPSPPALLPDPGPPGERKRVLFIDDEVRLGETLAIALAPHEVVSVHSGVDALACIESDRDFALVLCDLMIPDLSGPEIYQRVRTLDPAFADRFVFISGGAFTERAREMLARSEVRLIKKPFELKTIEALLDECSSPEGV